MVKNRRLLIIGIDGAHPVIMRKVVEMGNLKNLKKVLDGGYSGTLWSTFPYITPAAWTSFYTGVPPEKHGLLDFYLVRRNGSFRYLSYSDALFPGFWEYLNDLGFRVILVNLPMLTRSYEINGVIIPGFPAIKPMPYPNNIKHLIEKFDYKVHVEGFETRALEKKDVLKEIIDIAEKRRALSEYLLENFDWDLFFIVFTGTDLAQHVAISDYDALLSIYQIIDEFINVAFDHLIGDDGILILSDHGFMPIRKAFYTNNWLIQKGFLKYRGGTKLSRLIDRLRMTSIGKHYGPIIEEKVWRFFLKESSKESFISKLLERISGISGFFSLQNVLRESKVVGFSSNMPIIYLFLYDESIREDLIIELQSIVDPDNNDGCIIKNIYTPATLGWESINNKYEEFFYIPSLIVELKPGYTALTQKISSENKYLDLPPLQRHGDHSPRGVLAFYGKYINRQTRVSEVITNITKQVLWYMGVKVPRNIYGDLIPNMFCKEINGEEKLSVKAMKLIIRKRMKSPLVREGIKVGK